MAVDTEAVDLRMHPGLATASFTVLTQRAGDCIFVPYSMLHAVEKVRATICCVCLSFLGGSDMQILRTSL